MSPKKEDVKMKMKKQFLDYTKSVGKDLSTATGSFLSKRRRRNWSQEEEGIAPR